MQHQTTTFWRSKTGFVLLGFLAVAGLFLVTEHTAHVLGALPYLLLATCPLMHLFMHHGHDHKNHGDPPTHGTPGEAKGTGGSP